LPENGTDCLAKHRGSLRLDLRNLPMEPGLRILELRAVACFDRFGLDGSSTFSDIPDSHQKEKTVRI